MRMTPVQRRHLSLLVVGLLALGLIAFAVFHVLRWQAGGGGKAGSIVVRRVTVAQAPMAVQEAASRLATSRVAYAIPIGDVTYLVISTGEMGERVEVAGARQDEAVSGLIHVDVTSSSAGERLLILEMRASVYDTRMVQFNLDGHAALLPALVNADGVPLMALPDKEFLVVAAPQPNTRIVGGVVQVSGYARIFEGQFQATVFSAGKGRVLGEAQVAASVGAPNWGSFRVNIPITVPQGITEGVLVLHDDQTGVKMIVPLHFGTK